MNVKEEKRKMDEKFIKSKKGVKQLLSEMDNKKFFFGYSISPGYSKVTIYIFNSANNTMDGTQWLVPDKNRTRKEKYELICAELLEVGIVILPEYEPTKKEQK
jgi:hypothetical protein